MQPKITCSILIRNTQDEIYVEIHSPILERTWQVDITYWCTLWLGIALQSFMDCNVTTRDVFVISMMLCSHVLLCPRLIYIYIYYNHYYIYMFMYITIINVQFNDMYSLFCPSILVLKPFLRELYNFIVLSFSVYMNIIFSSQLYGVLWTGYFLWDYAITGESNV